MVVLHEVAVVVLMTMVVLHKVTVVVLMTN